MDFAALASLINIPHIPTFRPLGIPIQPFGVLVGTALVVGYMLGRRRARLTGLDPDICADGMVWTVAGGFIVAHLVSVIFYFPHRIIEKPWVLLAFWAGLSSFGGFIGGALGAFLFFKKKGVSVLQYADAILFGLVPAWIFGRMGCTVVHDHPGIPTKFFLAIMYPGPDRLAGTADDLLRHDLGFYEMLFSIGLTGVLYSLKNFRPFHGFHPAVVLLLYAPVRFYFDTLRIADKKYFGFTPGQYFAGAMVILAVTLIVHGRRLKAKGIAPGLQPPDAGKGKPSAGKGKKKSKSTKAKGK